jgi:hypothetical protein
LRKSVVVEVKVAEVAPVGAGVVAVVAGVATGAVVVLVVVEGFEAVVVVAGVGVVLVVTGVVVALLVLAAVIEVSTQHFFQYPTAGSPKVALSHTVELVNVLMT